MSSALEWIAVFVTSLITSARRERILVKSVLEIDMGAVYITSVIQRITTDEMMRTKASSICEQLPTEMAKLAKFRLPNSKEALDLLKGEGKLARHFMIKYSECLWTSDTTMTCRDGSEKNIMIKKDVRKIKDVSKDVICVGS